MSPVMGWVCGWKNCRCSCCGVLPLSLKCMHADAGIPAVHRSSAASSAFCIAAHVMSVFSIMTVIVLDLAMDSEEENVII